jgi:hypothetical protein
MPEQKEQAIRERAYAIWEEEGRPDGQDLEHWRRAEDEVNSAGEATENKTPEHRQPIVGVAMCNLTAGGREKDGQAQDH